MRMYSDTTKVIAITALVHLKRLLTQHLIYAPRLKFQIYNTLKILHFKYATPQNRIQPNNP